MTPGDVARFARCFGIRTRRVLFRDRVITFRADERRTYRDVIYRYIDYDSRLIIKIFRRRLLKYTIELLLSAIVLITFF